jgi:hypothetical protein
MVVNTVLLIGIFVLFTIIIFSMRGKKISKNQPPPQQPPPIRHSITPTLSSIQYAPTPVKAGTLKLTNDRDNVKFDRLPGSLYSSDYHRPYPPSPYVHPLLARSGLKFIGSASAYSPLPEVPVTWEKIGTLTTVDITDDTILNLYRRPIAPLQDLFEYRVQDKDGFIIPLKNKSYIEDGDIVDSVEGKEAKGEWKVSIYVDNKYVFL